VDTAIMTRSTSLTAFHTRRPRVGTQASTILTLLEDEGRPMTLPQLEVATGIDRRNTFSRAARLIAGGLIVELPVPAKCPVTGQLLYWVKAAAAPRQLSLELAS
jgi:hypothetical protein